VEVQRAHVCGPGGKREGSGCYAAATGAPADAAYLLVAEDALVWVVGAVAGEGGGGVVEEGGDGEVGVEGPVPVGDGAIVGAFGAEGGLEEVQVVTVPGEEEAVVVDVRGVVDVCSARRSTN
jgi:hypothetical protein